MIPLTKNKQSGQAMIIVAIFSVLLALGVAGSLAGATVRGAKISRELIDSKKSFYAAESGVEDAVYRFKNGHEVDTGEVLTIDDSVVTLALLDSNVGSGKIISVAGETREAVRALEVELIVGQGVDFHYGIQAGLGGLDMSGSSGVEGNVYSNGDILGSGTSYITGSAIAANSAELYPDQINDTPSTPTSYVTFGDATETQDTGQSFQLDSVGPINKVSLYLRKVGAPGNLTVSIASDASGSPGSTLVSATLSASLVTNQFGWVDVVFPTNPALQAGVTYWLVLDGSSNASKYYDWATNATYSNGLIKTGRVGSSWLAVSPAKDGYFKIYLGGLNSKISGANAGGLFVGTGGVGEAYAHTVNNATVAGALYCQSGTGNNKVCNATRPDPDPQPFSISEGNILNWQAEAEAGGVINGDVSISDATPLGPKKIIGNLNVGNSGELVVTGTLWVTGNVTVTGNASISLDPGYSESSGVIVSDGLIDLGGSSPISGSGQDGSYILLLTTSACPDAGGCNSAPAIELSGTAGAIILNAQKGTINFSGNASVKEMTAYKINLSGGAIIEYESGLVNLNFSSGPSGGFNILNWGEI